MSKRKTTTETFDPATGTVVTQPSTDGTTTANGPKQSPAVADIDSGIKGIQLTLREDGTVTMRMLRMGLAQKVVTMYPLQWEALAAVMPQLQGKFSEPGTPIVATE